VSGFIAAGSNNASAFKTTYQDRNPLEARVQKSFYGHKKGVQVQMKDTALHNKTFGLIIIISNL
jgi:hypothetical protein